MANVPAGQNPFYSPTQSFGADDHNQILQMVAKMNPQDRSVLMNELSRTDRDYSSFGKEPIRESFCRPMHTLCSELGYERLDDDRFINKIREMARRKTMRNERLIDSLKENFSHDILQREEFERLQDGSIEREEFMKNYNLLLRTEDSKRTLRDLFVNCAENAFTDSLGISRRDVDHTAKVHEAFYKSSGDLLELFDESIIEAKKEEIEEATSRIKKLKRRFSDAEDKVDEAKDAFDNAGPSTLEVIACILFIPLIPAIIKRYLSAKSDLADKKEIADKRKKELLDARDVLKAQTSKESIKAELERSSDLNKAVIEGTCNKHNASDTAKHSMDEIQRIKDVFNSHTVSATDVNPRSSHFPTRTTSLPDLRSTNSGKSSSR